MTWGQNYYYYYYYHYYYYCGIHLGIEYDFGVRTTFVNMVVVVVVVVVNMVGKGRECY